jgi:stearoyl-CoA desaturase (delta-9 desaturase)
MVRLKMYWLGCGLVFVVAYLINMATITVLYHRGLAHGAVKLSPAARFLVVALGTWLTGLDPKGWVCMHRLHHAHSDTELDPHSPRHAGIFGVLRAQLRSYERVLVGLAKREEPYTSIVSDLDFDINLLNRRRLWYLPYLVHLVIAAAFAACGHWLVGVAYYSGMMSHPIEGWLVNSLGHAMGGRNFETPDDSRNNHVVAWLVCGEGFQNNHHRYPSSAKFSYRWWELDFGYVLCRVLEAIGFVTIAKSKLIPPPETPHHALG